MPKESFADRLRAAMEKQNMKQVDLVRAAASAGVKLGKSHVSQYVSGKTVPRTDILNFLAQTLHTDSEWLLGHDQDSACLLYTSLPHRYNPSAILLLL